jgi:hypothetical protein
MTPLTMTASLTYHIAGLAKFIQPGGMVLLSPQDELNRQEFLTLTAGILHAREYRTDVIVWCREGRWEWATSADPLPISAYIEGVPECQITVTDDTKTVRRVIQLGESTVTPVPHPVPEKRKSR